MYDLWHKLSVDCRSLTGWGRKFFSSGRFRRYCLLLSPQALIKSVWGTVSPVINQPQHEIGQWLLTVGEVKNAWSYASTPPYMFMTCSIKHVENLSSYNLQSLVTDEIWPSFTELSVILWKQIICDAERFCMAERETGSAVDYEGLIQWVLEFWMSPGFYVPGFFFVSGTGCAWIRMLWVGEVDKVACLLQWNYI